MYLLFTPWAFLRHTVAYGCQGLCYLDDNPDIIERFGDHVRSQHENRELLSR